MAISDTLSALRARFGSKITYKGATYAASVTSIGSDDPDYMPSGPGGNAAFDDERVFTVSPTAFANRPAPGETITWDGTAHLILGVRAIEFQGVATSWRITTLKQSGPNVSVDQAAQIAALPRPT